MLTQLAEALILTAEQHKLGIRRRRLQKVLNILAILAIPCSALQFVSLIQLIITQRDAKYFLVISGIVLLLFAMLFISVILVRLNKKQIVKSGIPVNEIDYMPGMSLGDWFDKTYQYLTRVGWVSVQWKVLEQLLPDPNYLKFCSPTANKGLIEEELAKLAKDSVSKCKFVVSDRLSLPKVVNSVEGVDYRYCRGVNAENIRTMLEGVGLEGVDVIWDIRGWLWYCADKKRKEHELEAAFDTYSNVLNKGGLIVVDAAEVAVVRRVLNNKIYKLFNKVKGFAEVSTYDQLKKNRKAMGKTTQNFMMMLVGEGIYRIAIFKKQ